MLFTSNVFVQFFLPLLLICYFLIPKIGIQGKNIVMLVHPRQYYAASVIGAKYATAHELSMLSLVNVDGTITKDFRALLADPKSKNVLTDKMVGKIEEFGNIIPF